MATHSSVLAWRIPWTEEPGGDSPQGFKESDTTGVTNTTVEETFRITTKRKGTGLNREDRETVLRLKKEETSLSKCWKASTGKLMW